MTSTMLQSDIITSKMRGKIYFPDISFDLNQKKVLEYVDEEYNPQELSNGVIINNQKFDNKIVKFDLVDTADEWGGYCKGFIYTDGKFLGKLHYLPESGLEDKELTGQFELKGQHTLLIHGKTGSNEQFLIYLSTKAIKKDKVNSKKVVSHRGNNSLPLPIQIKRNKGKRTGILYLHGVEQDARVLTFDDHQECDRLINGSPLIQMNFDWNYFPKNFMLGMSDKSKLPFYLGETYFARYNNRFEISYLCGVSERHYKLMKLNPHHLMAEVKKRCTKDGLFLNDEEDSNELSFYLNYKIKDKGTVKQYYEKGLKLVERSFKMASNSIIKSIIKNKELF